MEEGNRSRLAQQAGLFQAMSNSGATVEPRNNLVYKSGGFQNLLQEARLLRHLGAHVCPRFRGYYKEGYAMERCTPIEPVTSVNSVCYLLKRVHTLLSEKVWSRPTLYVIQKNWTNLHYEVLVNEAPWIPTEYATWAYENPGKACLTHGDPTLANVVLRGDELLLCDPLPPRTHWPSLRVVDYGKMLQSAAGWEHQLNDKWCAPSPEPIGVVMSLIPQEELMTSLFWAAFHYARISVADRNKGTPRGEWAHEQSLTFVDLLKRF